jgi:hypothetical protein
MGPLQQPGARAAREFPGAGRGGAGDEVRNDPGTVSCEDEIQHPQADNGLGVGEVPSDEAACATKDAGVLPGLGRDGQRLVARTRRAAAWFTYAAALTPLPSLAIDRIINRTLAYGLLTVVLGSCYAAGSLVFVLVAGRWYWFLRVKTVWLNPARRTGAWKGRPSRWPRRSADRWTARRRSVMLLLPPLGLFASSAGPLGRGGALVRVGGRLPRDLPPQFPSASPDRIEHGATSRGGQPVAVHNCSISSLAAEKARANGSCHELPPSCSNEHPADFLRA